MKNLHKQLIKLAEDLHNDMQKKWDRSLPFPELLFDRWDSGRKHKFGIGTSVYHTSYIYGKPQVGKNTWIGPFTILDATGGLTIGDNCSISAGVHIYTHDTVAWAVSGGNRKAERKPVAIGNCCYIGAQSVIAKGVVIGDHAVVGANSYVNKNVPARTVVAGSPARIIGTIMISKNKSISIKYYKKKQ
ncbi:MAG: acyltransferase [Elusimicrobia bacterium]|nr:acyltransferase [Elusimicrobiota bacterium]MBD3412610.1 acyltransferase [Elusimicrobiota bacterium]